MVAADYLVVRYNPLRGAMIREVLEKNKDLIAYAKQWQEEQRVCAKVTLMEPYIDDRRVTAMMFQLEDYCGASILEHRGNSMFEFHGRAIVTTMSADEKNERRRKAV